MGRKRVAQYFNRAGLAIQLNLALHYAASFLPPVTLPLQRANFSLLNALRVCSVAARKLHDVHFQRVSIGRRTQELA